MFEPQVPIDRAPQYRKYLRFRTEWAATSLHELPPLPPAELFRQLADVPEEIASHFWDVISASYNRFRARILYGPSIFDLLLCQRGPVREMFRLIFKENKPSGTRDKLRRIYVRVLAWLYAPAGPR